MIFLSSAWQIGWTNNRVLCDLIRHDALGTSLYVENITLWYWLQFWWGTGKRSKVWYRLIKLCEGNQLVFPTQRTCDAKIILLLPGSISRKNVELSVTQWSSCVVTLCERNPPVTDWFPSQRGIDVDDKCMLWRHDEPWMCPNKLQWTPDISSDHLRPSCTALIVDIYLWLGLCKGTVSGLWRTMEIPIALHIKISPAYIVISSVLLPPGSVFEAVNTAHYCT